MTRLPLAMLAVSTLGGTVAAIAETGVPLRESVPHITTTGHAMREVVPDQADIRVAVKNERPTAQEATAITAKAATDIVDAIKAAGTEPRDIKTNFDVEAQYAYVTDQVTHTSRQTFRGYAATETITIRVRDVSKAGRLARDFIDKGANAFQRIDYSYSKEKAARRQLDAEAMRDALDAAKTYTDAIGVKLGRVLQIGEETSNGEDGAADLPSRRAPPVAAATIAVPTEPGVQQLTESILVIWEIEGKAPQSGIP